MRIDLNGQPHHTDAKTLSDLLAELGLDGAGVATAVNGAFAPRPQRPATRLSEGDAVEVLRPMEGG